MTARIVVQTPMMALLSRAWAKLLPRLVSKTVR
jgi:hypothetical protein